MPVKNHAWPKVEGAFGLLALGKKDFGPISHLIFSVLQVIICSMHHGTKTAC